MQWFLALKPNYIFCFMETNLFTFHVYKNLHELVKNIFSLTSLENINFL